MSSLSLWAKSLSLGFKCKIKNSLRPEGYTMGLIDSVYVNGVPLLGKWNEPKSHRSESGPNYLIQLAYYV